MSDLPDAPRTDRKELAERRLSSQDFELVIRRAAELQARAAEEEAGGDGVSEAEALRIGRELGLSGRHLERALAEVHARTPAESGVLFKVYGAATVTCSRTVPSNAPAVRDLLERYLLQCEYMAVLRRFPDRTLYTRGEGIGAAIGRAARGVFDRTPLLKLPTLEVAVRQLEEGFSHVTLGTSLSRARAGAAAGGVLVGGWAGSALAAFLGIAVDPALAVAGLPVLGGGVLGSRWAYASVTERTQLQLDSLLDRLEHGEIVVPPARRSFAR